MDGPAANINKHGLLLSQDHHLASLWNDMQKAKHTLMGARSTASAHNNNKRQILKWALDAVELCLGHLRWKQRRWLKGGVAAVKAITPALAFEQKQEGNLFRDLLLQKAQLARELAALEDGSKYEERGSFVVAGWSMDRSCLGQ